MIEEKMMIIEFGVENASAGQLFFLFFFYKNKIKFVIWHRIDFCLCRKKGTCDELDNAIAVNCIVFRLYDSVCSACHIDDMIVGNVF